MVQSQVAELAQTKVESNSKMSVKIFGTILSDTFYNSGDTNWADNPSIALVPPGVGTTTASSVPPCGRAASD